MAELKTKVVRGFFWNSVEKVASALFQIYISIRVANLLFPDDYGVMAILVAFVTVFNTFVDSGFSQALIRKSHPTEKDFSSAFWFNVLVSILIYGILVGLSFPAAKILDMPDLSRLAPILYLVVPLWALNIIQQTVLARQFEFKRLSAITFISIVGSGIVAVVLAVKGFGVWALVGQRVTQMGLRAVLLWSFGKWKPQMRFSGNSIRTMSAYSSRVMGTDMINNLYGSIPQFVIGNIHQGTLGNYDMARKLKDLPVTSVMVAMQAVTFPALSNLKNDDRKFSDSIGKVISSIVFIMFPMMAGLIVVAGDFFQLFLKPEWHGAVPFFRILCLTGMMTPITVVSYNIMKTRGNGGTLLKAEIVKKVFATAVLAAVIPFGPIAIAWGMVGISFTDIVVSFSMGKRFCDYGAQQLALDVLPVLALTSIMALSVWGVGLLFPFWPLWVLLSFKIAVGIAVYLAGASVMKLDGFGEFMEIVRKFRS